MRAAIRSPAVLLAAAGIAVAVAERVVLWRSDLGVLDSDEAAWGLIARHVLQGEVPTFFWGQWYGGTLEPLLTAPIFWIAGSGTVTLRLVPLALTTLAAFLVRAVGRRTIGEPAATAAALLFLVWPGYVVWKSTRAHGFYGSGVVLTLLLLLLVLRLHERPSRRDAALLGLVLGLACWQTAQIVPVALPALAWLVATRRRVLRLLPVAVPAALLGAAPAIAWNVRHDWASLTRTSTEYGTYWTHLRGFFGGTLPMALGTRVAFENTWLESVWIGGAATVAAYLLFAWYAVRARGPVALLVVVAAAYPFIYAYGWLTYVVDEPRYVYLLTPVLALLVAVPLTTVPRAAAGVAAGAAVAVLGLVSLSRSGAWEQRQEASLADHPISKLISTLDAHRVDRVLTTYWLTYPIAFVTRERIIAAESSGGHFRRVDGRVVVPIAPKIRYRPYGAAVARAHRTAYVILVRETRQADLPEHVFRSAGYQRTVTGGYVVWLPP